MVPSPADSQINGLAEVLAAAFRSYPLARWLLGKAPSAEPRLISLFRTLFALPTASKFTIQTADNGNAIAVWLASEQLPLFTELECPLVLQHFQRELGSRAARRLLQFQIASDRHHNGGDFDYLFLLAVMPDMQRRGLGGALLSSHLQQIKALNRRVVLETANESNVKFYNRFGFSVVDEYKVGNGAPLTWVMELPATDLEDDTQNI